MGSVTSFFSRAETRPLSVQLSLVDRGCYLLVNHAARVLMSLGASIPLAGANWLLHDLASSRFYAPHSHPRCVCCNNGFFWDARQSCLKCLEPRGPPAFYLLVPFRIFFVFPSLSLSLFLSLSIFIHLSIYLSISISIYLYICIDIDM